MAKWLREAMKNYGPLTIDYRITSKKLSTTDYELPTKENYLTNMSHFIYSKLFYRALSSSQIIFEVLIVHVGLPQIA